MSTQFNWYRFGQRAGAFSLIELLVVMLIVTILAAVAVPAIQHQLRQYYFIATRDRLLSAIYQSKVAAVRCHCVMILCGTNDGKHCTPSWQQSWMIRPLLSDQPTSLVRLNLMSQMRLNWRGNFKNRPGIYFNGLGETLGQQGRFSLQLGPNKIEIILTMFGRVRVSQ